MGNACIRLVAVRFEIVIFAVENSFNIGQSTGFVSCVSYTARLVGHIQMDIR